MANNSAAVSNFGDLTTAIYVTSRGVTIGYDADAAPMFPNDATTAPSNTVFNPLGWLNDSGITFSHAMDSNDRFAMQGSTLIGSLKSNETYSFAAEALEDNLILRGLIHGGTATSTAALGTFDVMSNTAGDIRSAVIDIAASSTKKLRYLCSRVDVSEFGDAVYVANDFVVYPFTLKVYADDNGQYFRLLSTMPGHLTPEG